MAVLRDAESSALDLQCRLAQNVDDKSSDSITKAQSSTLEIVSAPQLRSTIVDIQKLLAQSQTHAAFILENCIEGSEIPAAAFDAPIASFQGSISALQAMTASLAGAYREARFTLFSELPPEIRSKIWKGALPGPRIVEVHYDKWASNSDGRILRASLPVPEMFHVCRESRQEALKVYKQTGNIKAENGLEYSYARWEQQGDEFWNCVLSSSTFQHLKYLALGEKFMWWVLDRGLSFLLGFKNLIELAFVFDDYYSNPNYPSFWSNKPDIFDLLSISDPFIFEDVKDSCLVYLAKLVAEHPGWKCPMITIKEIVLEGQQCWFDHSNYP